MRDNPWDFAFFAVAALFFFCVYATCEKRARRKLATFETTQIWGDATRRRGANASRYFVMWRIPDTNWLQAVAGEIIEGDDYLTVIDTRDTEWLVYEIPNELLFKVVHV